MTYETAMAGRSPAGTGLRERVLGTVGGLVGVALVGFLDWKTGTEISFSVIYLVPIAVASWFGGRSAGMVMAFLGATTWFLVEYLAEQRYSAEWIAYWNATVRGVFFLVVAVLLSRTRYLQDNLEALVRERTAALNAEVDQRRRVEREIGEINHWEQLRIAHELHDHLGAALAGVAFRCKAICENLERQGNPEAAGARLVVGLVNNSIDQVRSLARVLAPAEDGKGLGTALSRLGSEMETLFGITCLIETAKDLPVLDADQSRQLYRIAQEAARNAIRHGGAQLVRISLTADGREADLVVAADGRRWSPEEGSNEGLGLRIMAYRAGVLGGSLALEPGDPDGSIARCRIPLIRPPTLPSMTVDPARS